MVNFILKLFRPFRKLLEWAGVNYQQFEVILRVKLTMDNRKAMGINAQNTQKKELRNAMSMQVFTYGIMGMFMAMILMRGSSALSFFTLLLFSFIMIMVIMGLIAEFNTILFDTRDNSILLPRPISPRTLLFVRIMHIMIYLMVISLSLSLIPLIVFAFMFGIPAMLLLLLDVILITVFSVFLTNIIYLLLMKFTTGERLKDIIVYAQIFMAIIFMGGYQLMPRLAENQQLMSSMNEFHWWMFLIPPFWMSGSITPIVKGGFDLHAAIFLFLSVAMPLLGLWLVNNVLAKNFSGNLATLDEGDTKKEKNKGKAETSSLVDFLSGVFSFSPVERISFRMTWQIANRDRKFKQAVYPSLGSILIIIVMVFVNSRIPFSEIGSTQKYLALIYAPYFILFTIIFSLKFSDNFKASWIYQTLPVQNPGHIISGAFKAIMVQLFLPVFLIVNIATIYIWGFSVLVDVVTGLCATLVLAYAILLTESKVFPFSDEKSASQSGMNVVRTLVMLFAVGILVGIHYLMIIYKINLLYILPVFVVILYFLSRRYRLTSWRKMKII
jgi:ABC-2 type transport system permease protein